MSQTIPSWELYERLIAQLFANQAGTDLCVTANARIRGRISGRSRQLDVLMEARHDTDNSRRVIVDAKRRKRRVDVKDVESFRGLMEDVGATHGYLVSPHGYSSAAGRRAQELVSLRIVPLDRLEDFDPSLWPKCNRANCDRGRVFWDGYPELTMVVRSIENPSEVTAVIPRIHYVGKCDRCSAFHVRCTKCNDLLYIPENDETDIGQSCQCRPPWFWLASIESDEEGYPSAELHVCMPGNVWTVDRRSL